MRLELHFLWIDSRSGYRRRHTPGACWASPTLEDHSGLRPNLWHESVMACTSVPITRNLPATIEYRCRSLLYHRWNLRILKWVTRHTLDEPATAPRMRC